MRVKVREAKPLNKEPVRIRFKSRDGVGKNSLTVAISDSERRAICVPLQLACKRFLSS